MTIRLEPEEWTDEYGIGNCDHCGKKSCRVVFDANPFIADHPELNNPGSNWCWSCYQESLMDI